MLSCNLKLHKVKSMSSIEMKIEIKFSSIFKFEMNNVEYFAYESA